MSVTSFLLLSLLFIAASGTSSSSSRIGRGNDGSEFYAKSITDMFRNAVKYRRKIHIYNHIAKNFTFTACTTRCGKTAVYDYLNMAPKDFTVEFISSHYIQTNVTIEYIVAVRASQTDYNLTVVMKNFDTHYFYVVMYAKLNNCPRYRRLTADSEEQKTSLELLNVDGDNRKLGVSIAKVFISKMNKVIASRDRSQVAALFHDNFTFNGCEDSFNKQGLVDRFLSNATLTQSIGYISSARVLRGIPIKVVVRGYEAEPFFVTLRIGRRLGKFLLLDGHTTSCPKRALFTITVQPFFDSLTEAITDRNVDLISEHFDNSFLFTGCTGDLTKDQFVKMLSSLPEGRKFKFSVQRDYLLRHGRIGCVVEVVGYRLGRVKYTLERQRSGRYVLTDGLQLYCVKLR